MMKSSKLLNIMMIIFFIIAITVPMITINKKNGMISVSENRYLANFPNILTVEGKTNTQFPKEFELWLNDNMGFRDKFVQTNNLIQYGLFGKLTRNDLVIGKNNWLYFMYPNMLRAYQNLDFPSNEQLQLYDTKISRLEKYFQSINTPFITMVNPGKETIYPEFMPDNILKTKSQERTDLVIDYLNEKSNVDIFSPKKSLINAKGKANVYSQNFDLSHWNDYGAYIAYLDLMERIKAYYPDINILSESDFIIEEITRKSKLYGVIEFEELDNKFTYNKEFNSYQELGALGEMERLVSDYSFRYVNNNKDLPKLLIVGDSYLHMFVLPYLAESFSELIFVHEHNMKNIKDYINIFSPDIFLLEFWEQSFHYFIESVTYPENYFEDYSQYQDLNVVDSTNQGNMWLDIVNNNYLTSGNSVTLNQTNQVVTLDGWAIDNINSTVASNIFMKVGEKYYSGNYGSPRTSVSDHFNNPNLTNSGFKFTVKASDLIEAGEFSFIIISQDKSYQYAPVKFKVETN